METNSADRPEYRRRLPHCARASGTQGPDELRSVIERWLTDAQSMCKTSTDASDLDWLSGRIRALHDVLALLDEGVDNSPPGSLPVQQ